MLTLQFFEFYDIDLVDSDTNIKYMSHQGIERYRITSRPGSRIGCFEVIYAQLECPHEQKTSVLQLLCKYINEAHIEICEEYRSEKDRK